MHRDFVVEVQVCSLEELTMQLGGLEPRQLDGREASLVSGKLEGNEALPEPGQFDGKAA